MHGTMCLGFEAAALAPFCFLPYGKGFDTGPPEVGTQHRKLKYIFVFFLVFGRFSAKVGPKSVPNGPGLKNASYISEK